VVARTLKGKESWVDDIRCRAQHVCSDECERRSASDDDDAAANNGAVLPCGSTDAGAQTPCERERLCKRGGSVISLASGIYLGDNLEYISTSIRELSQGLYVIRGTDNKNGNIYRRFVCSSSVRLQKSQKTSSGSGEPAAVLCYNS